ncbi:PBECR4 domain-containing protein [Lysinibacillus xylanilyticus]|uniref:Phage-Barnase-EndoU-ColicinE5/D-RelE like nuclease 4 domain-containing protein n=1 Tax=Lysinibacillus xylanilyticus TaxID=582475 RepID=A0A2M9Q5Q1_9BACI|nr:PBECR4 domain-containing protein [Lysinibacillus xylanilyticus]PJO43409.1 hypothetical protein CWD94_12735 [Lysinibacillus xylanilyticus]
MVECIQKGIAAYETFVNKEVHYVYKKDGAYKEVVLNAKKKEFMHFCGVSYLDLRTKKKVSAPHFYNLAKANRISPSFLIEKEDGTTNQKLEVIGNLADILTPNVRVIDGQVTFFNFSFDMALRSRRQIIALSLIKENVKTDFYVPFSLLNLQTDKANSLRKSYEVHCIYSRSRDNSDYIYYQSKEYEGENKKKTKTCAL